MDATEAKGPIRKDLATSHSQEKFSVSVSRKIIANRSCGTADFCLKYQAELDGIFKST